MQMLRKVALVIFLSVTLHVEATHKQQLRYVFTLPDNYIGWVQIIFDDQKASPFPIRNGAYLVEVPESGIPRTSDTRFDDPKAKDEFYYRHSLPDGTQQFTPVPPDYMIPDDSHGGFAVKDTGGKGLGYSWFIFIGPPEVRSKIPLADWDKVLVAWKKTHGNYNVIVNPYPTPGRLSSAPQVEVQRSPS
jgi:hypothetical protein